MPSNSDTTKQEDYSAHLDAYEKNFTNLIKDFLEENESIFEIDSATNHPKKIINKTIEFASSIGQLTRIFDEFPIPTLPHETMIDLYQRNQIAEYINDILNRVGKVLIDQDGTKLRPEIIEAIGTENFNKIIKNAELIIQSRLTDVEPSDLAKEILEELKKRYPNDKKIQEFSDTSQRTTDDITKFINDNFQDIKDELEKKCTYNLASKQCRLSQEEVTKMAHKMTVDLMLQSLTTNIAQKIYDTIPQSSQNDQAYSLATYSKMIRAISPGVSLYGVHRTNLQQLKVSVEGLKNFVDNKDCSNLLSGTTIKALNSAYERLSEDILSEESSIRMVCRGLCGTFSDDPSEEEITKLAKIKQFEEALKYYNEGVGELYFDIKKILINKPDFSLTNYIQKPEVNWFKSLIRWIFNDPCMLQTKNELIYDAQIKSLNHMISNQEVPQYKNDLETINSSRNAICENGTQIFDSQSSRKSPNTVVEVETEEEKKFLEKKEKYRGTLFESREENVSKDARDENGLTL